MHNGNKNLQLDVKAHPFASFTNDWETLPIFLRTGHKMCQGVTNLFKTIRKFPDHLEMPLGERFCDLVQFGCGYI